jgi:TRAP-type C4-dicarboxylate transport system substrate-binding protein
MQEAADEAMAYQIEISREDTARGLEFLKEQGMEVHEPTPEEIDAFRQATKPAFDSWAEKIGPDLVKLFQETVEEARSGQSSN